jgi:hypothetical protein
VNDERVTRTRSHNVLSTCDAPPTTCRHHSSTSRRCVGRPDPQGPQNQSTTAPPPSTGLDGSSKGFHVPLMFERASIGVAPSIVTGYGRSFNSLLSAKNRPVRALRPLAWVAATRSGRSPLPPKCPNHRRVFASRNWLGGKSIANGIHHLAADRVARASQRIHRDPLCLQLCVLGPLRRLRAACRQKIAERVATFEVPARQRP